MTCHDGNALNHRMMMCQNPLATAIWLDESGTSLDGIDVALLVTDGETVTSRGPSMTYAITMTTSATLLKQALADAAED